MILSRWKFDPSRDSKSYFDLLNTCTSSNMLHCRSFVQYGIIYCTNDGLESSNSFRRVASIDFGHTRRSYYFGSRSVARLHKRHCWTVGTGGSATRSKGALLGSDPGEEERTPLLLHNDLDLGSFGRVDLDLGAASSVVELLPMTARHDSSRRRKRALLGNRPNASTDAPLVVRSAVRHSHFGAGH